MDRIGPSLFAFIMIWNTNLDGERFAIVRRCELGVLLEDLGEEFSEMDKAFIMNQMGDGKMIRVETFIPFMKKKYH